ncbi:MAG TPA: hypothetical protein VL051_06370 [Burkholderiaceae bacterium]|nr:hypothetical protein [Burkholderiaceae bacterium]
MTCINLSPLNTHEVRDAQQDNDFGRRLRRSPASIPNRMTINAAHLALDIPGIGMDPPAIPENG